MARKNSEAGTTGWCKRDKKLPHARTAAPRTALGGSSMASRDPFDAVKAELQTKVNKLQQDYTRCAPGT